MLNTVTTHLKANGKITLAEARDMFHTSRKYAQAFMEHLDSQKITRRVGDDRVLIKRVTGSYLSFLLALESRKIIPPRHNRKIPMPMGEPQPNISIPSNIAPPDINIVLMITFFNK